MLAGTARKVAKSTRLCSYTPPLPQKRDYHTAIFWQFVCEIWSKFCYLHFTTWKCSDSSRLQILFWYAEFWMSRFDGIVSLSLQGRGCDPFIHLFSPHPSSVLLLADQAAPVGRLSAFMAGWEESEEARRPSLSSTMSHVREIIECFRGRHRGESNFLLHFGAPTPGFFLAKCSAEKTKYIDVSQPPHQGDELKRR